MSATVVTLSEWERLRPEGRNVLSGRNFGNDEPTRRLAEALTQGDRIEILELAKGLELRAKSYVGRIRLGDLTISIKPKLPEAPFLRLLRYAYGLRDLEYHEKLGYATDQHSFQDLLVHQLLLEAEELNRRGLHRDYLRREEHLASPKGRFDFSKMATSLNRGQATLPCVHFPRNEDNALNRALVAGLKFAHGLAVDSELRAQLSRLLHALSERITSAPLTDHLLEQAQAMKDRRTTAYESAFILIGLLRQGDGVSLETETSRVRLPGFLFDMNLFFQRLLSRFLSENLPDLEVEDEHHFKELFAYDPERNPLQRRAPIQKPDFVIRRDGRIVALLDAKYRDLWETPLPREMLYQLSLYALGREGADKSAVILYPTLNERARDQTILIRQPSTGRTNGEVILRPVHLRQLECLLRLKTPFQRRDARAYAEKLVTVQK